MNRNLYGYVRGLKIKGDSLEWEKPNIYTHYGDSAYETSVDVDCLDLCDPTQKFTSIQS